MSQRQLHSCLLKCIGKNVLLVPYRKRGFSEILPLLRLQRNFAEVPVAEKFHAVVRDKPCRVGLAEFTGTLEFLF